MESFQKKFKWMQSQRFESHQIIRFYWNPITEIWIMHLILNSFNWKQFYVMFDVSVPRKILFTHIRFIHCASFVFSLIWLDFHKRLQSCFVACFTSSESIWAFVHLFIGAWSTHTHTYDIHIIYGILKYSVTKAYILTASNELHKIKFNQ